MQGGSGIADLILRQAQDEEHPQVSLSNHAAYSAFTMGKRERDSSSKIGTVLRI